MIKRKRILALDVGKKRTGLAQSDPMFTIASPIGAYGNPEIFEKIREIGRQDEITRIILGWPIHLSGDKGASVEMVEKFKAQLERFFPDIPIDVLDERFTSSLAQQAIRDSGVNRKKRRDKGLVDAVAASILLQNYLDRIKSK